MSIHKASSSTWQDEAVPRLCQIVLEANTGIAQQIAENRTDLLDILPSSVLSIPTDDLGLTPAFLAVYYDRPEMIDYLHKRGVDLKKPCDAMNYGTPLFYAVSLGKTRLIYQLDMLTNSIGSSCDTFGQLPMVHAQRLDDHRTIEAINWAATKEKRAGLFFMKHWRRIQCRKMYFKMVKAIPLIQRIVRGMIGRKIIRSKRAAIEAIGRRAARKLRRDMKIAEGIDLDSDDEDTVIEGIDSISEDKLDAGNTT